ncbi:acyl-CoA dehydrogenase family protein [Sneathiella sp.]|uniref:acyl-CoA dehydrogenase family protein n=1 Tax=Sneathiella sp. TaxID=1964365 RepID=UPI00356233E5
MNKMTPGNLVLNFTEEHECYRAYVRNFATREIAPNSRKWDEENKIPWDAVRKMGEAGLLGVIAPKDMGGQARDNVSLGITIEELARADISCAIICWLQASIGTLMPGWGADTVRAVNAGEKMVALAMSEQDSGSDVGNTSTVAIRDGDDYIISGTKIHVSLVPGAQVMAVTAKTETEDSKMSISMFRVDADLPGVTVSSMEQMGARAHQLGRVIFDNVRVPSSALMGADGGGRQALNVRFNVSRCLSPLAAIGAAQTALEETIEFTKNRIVYGRPIATNQAVSFPLVEHWTRIEAARLMAYRALTLTTLGQTSMQEAAMAKWFGISSAKEAITDCLQLHGADGYLVEYPQEQRLRDVTALSFTGGTINIMKVLLVRELFGRDFSGLDPSA